ncbi:MAG: hypothetical protein JRH15_21430, partial [Deltaproteobacteria bacterium]|nr:hypothetical protein [Deltaproteobacteria bacterium]
ADKPIAADLIVNATSVSDVEESPEMAQLVANLKVPDCEPLVDMNYGRVNNFWEAWAQRHDVRFMDGLSSLTHQARRSFLLWTGIQVPAAEFKHALEK